MPKTQVKLIWLPLLVLFSLFFPSHLFASTYGEGDYGSDLYGLSSSPTPTPVSTQSSTSQSSGSPEAPACGDATPLGPPPWLYGAIPQSSTSIKLYFVYPDGPADKYVLEYGYLSGQYLFSSPNIGGPGTRTYVVNSLSPNTRYHFRVRAGNGCAVGPWSNVISAVTTKVISAPSLTILDSTLLPVDPTPTSFPSPPSYPAPSLFPSPPPRQTNSSYTLHVTVVNSDHIPLPGVKLRLQPTDETQTTSSLGQSDFFNLPSGNYTLELTYQGLSQTQSVNLSGSSSQVNLSLTLQTPSSSIPANWRLYIIGAGLLFLLLLLILIWHRRRKE